MNRTLVESARSVIFGAGLSKAYWGKANRVGTSSTEITPFEQWYKKKPDISHFKVFDA